jgi:hypothetical protein
MAKAKAAAVSITRDEWLKAMTDVGLVVDQDDDPSSLTISEFAEMFGLSHEAAGRKLRALFSANKATRAKKWVNGSDGRRILIASYKLT